MSSGQIVVALDLTLNPKSNDDIKRGEEALESV